MKTVYLIRHALPDFPGGERMCLGRTDLPLCAEGFRQARAMAEKLPKVVAVYSSPLTRAVQTAHAIGEPVILQDLQELFAGEWDGLTFREIRARYPELYAARGTDKTLSPPGAEPDPAGLERFYHALTQAATDSPGDLAVVTHGGILGLFLQDISGLWRKPDYGEIIPVLWDRGTFALQEDTQ